MKTYYNEFEPYAAQWLRNLIDAGELPSGVVDDRSIVDVKANELLGYTQSHFFAGIGGWPFALRLAGWPEGWPVWTGSCPCQPLSSAGKRKGGADERHLWPVWFELIRQCRPTVVFGEQVASGIALSWLDLVFDDLEAEGYACGAVDIPACSVGAPHIRQRLWWVAYNSVSELGNTKECGGVAGLCDSGQTGERGYEFADSSATGLLADAGEQGLPICESGELPKPKRQHQGRTAKQCCSSPWISLTWLPCRDGKARSTQPGIFPLAHGIPGRVGKLRAYGNAIVPQVAAEVIRVVMEYLIKGHL